MTKGTVERLWFNYTYISLLQKCLLEQDRRRVSQTVLTCKCIIHIDGKINCGGKCSIIYTLQLP